MTALDAGSVTRPAAVRHRTLNVVRLQFVNTQTFVWVPALVLGGAWVITLLIYWIIQSAGGVDVKIGGGSQAPLWYFLVVGVQAMTLTFPFSQAMSLTRREFYVGSLAAAAVSGLGMSLIFVLLGLVEQATDGYGLNGYFAYLEWVWEAGPLAAGLTYFVSTMLFFIIGFWFATIFKRFGTAKLVIVMLAIGLALVGLIALVSLRQAWPEVGTWILDTGSLGLTMWAVLVSALLAVGSYLTLRRMPA
ncbi:hypothetical protein AVL61_06495 [Kocuria rosea subsp. polaris]|uniref:Uncharacterized protein n=1 Tax=Kocuria rosea subsp. polaris TaxID=136273 RepID=A0A0W8I9Y3_KOCRO|nr:hypothetical protein [Kocuria polaris]KUG56698.1 hypothetical protein AVL61_06495 [Kocuria polaris]